MLAATPSAASAEARYRLTAALDLEHARVAGHASFIPDRDASDEVRFVMPRSHLVRRVGGGAAALLADPTNDALQILQVRSTRRGRTRLPVTIDYEGPVNASTSLVEMGLQDGWFPDPERTAFSLQIKLKGLPARFTVLSDGRVSHRGDWVSIARKAQGYDALIVAEPGLQSRKAGEVEIYSVHPDVEDSLVLQRHADAALKFVENWFGPGPRPMRIAAVDHQRAGGYYQPGLVVVAGKRKPFSPDFYDLDAGYLMAHEFAHQAWPEFGLPKGDKWLAECIASYVGLRFVEERFGVQKLDATLDLYRRFMPKDAGPMLTGGSEEPSNGALYFRGPLILFALERRIGRPAMDELLRAYERRPGRSTTTFLQALEQAGGAAVARQFGQAMRDPNPDPDPDLWSKEASE